MADGTQPAAAGHNSSALTDDQQQALFWSHLGKIKRQRDKIASLTGELRQAYKLAKAEGFSKADLDYALRLESEDETEAIDRRRREAQIARWMAHPIGTQSDLFDGVDRTPAVDKAYATGKIAAFKGDAPIAPYADGGSEQAQAWLRGHHDGSAELRDIQSKKNPPAPLLDASGKPKAEGEKRKGGRPKKDAAPADGPDLAAVKARTEADLAEAPAEVSEPFHTRLRRENDAVAAGLRAQAERMNRGEPPEAA